MWFRGYSSWTEEEGAPRVAALLKRYKVKRIVSGHTVQSKGQITERFGGAVFLNVPSVGSRDHRIRSEAGLRRPAAVTYFFIRSRISPSFLISSP